MKELSIEEKAKRYDEVLNKLRHFIAKGVNPLITIADAQDFFPELRESDDERIRKEIIIYLKSILSNKKYGDEFIEDWIAWLEKQGEQKQEVEGNPNARKPTLRIVKGKSYLCIKDYRDKNCTFTKGKIYKSDKDGFLVDDEEKDTFERKIWEEDAIEYFFLFEQSKTKDVVTDEKQTLADKIEPKFKVGNKIKLAKEPEYHAREIIAIQNDAYYFDEAIYLPFSRQDEWELVEQKPAETEKGTKGNNGEIPNSAWSEEDEENSKNILYILNQLKGTAIYKEDKTAENCIDWLKSLKDRVQPQQSQEWSEEDEKMVEDIIEAIDTQYAVSDYQEMVTWLKFLRPQNRWKPTKRQLLELRCVISGCSFDTPVLVELEGDLKKLMEE